MAHVQLPYIPALSASSIAVRSCSKLDRTEFHAFVPHTSNQSKCDRLCTYSTPCINAAASLKRVEMEKSVRYTFIFFIWLRDTNSDPFLSVISMACPCLPHFSHVLENNNNLTQSSRHSIVKTSPSDTGSLQKTCNAASERISDLFVLLALDIQHTISKLIILKYEIKTSSSK